MNSLTKSIAIHTTAERIWDILADVTRTPEWIDGVQESERTGDIREGKGLRWRERSVLERQNIEMEHEMTEWEPGRRLKVCSTLPMNGRLERTLEIQKWPEGCDISIHVAWDLGIAGMLLGERKVAAMMDSLFEVTLANLKDLAEKSS